MFSHSINYCLTEIPKELGFFERKKWISEQKNLISEYCLFFNNNEVLTWVEVEEDQKYWYPYEKLKFFISYLNIVQKTFLIIEKVEGQVVFYVVINEFLYFYGTNYDQATKMFKNYNVFDYFSIGINVQGEYVCKVNYNFFVANNFNENKFLFEETAQYDGINQKFLKWFKQNNENKYFADIVFILILILIFGANIYLRYLIICLTEILEGLLNG